jgi:hypothetical protein
MSKLDYLIHIVENIERRQLLPGTVNVDQFQGLLQGKFTPTCEIVGIRQEAKKSLPKLVEEFFNESNEIQRGTNFNDLLQVIMNVIFDDFVERKANTLTEADVANIKNKISIWFKQNSTSLTAFVPCVITIFPGASFSIGPVKFDFISQFMANEQANASILQNLPANMNSTGASWIATVVVSGCVRNRALEFADLAVDLALVGLQLVFPIDSAERIARMNGKNLPIFKSTYYRTNGRMSGSNQNQHPTLGLGQGWIEKIVFDGREILNSVGHRMDAYLSDTKKLPKLEQAWCDGAYWYHEGLAEPLETIAVTKLETAIDVLFHSESTSKTKQRLLQAMKLVYKLTPDQFINKDQTITVKGFVEGLIRDRSRILHGTWSTLMTNMRESRPNLMFLARDFLRAYTLALDRYLADPKAQDNIEKFLNWIEANL